ncbi:WD40 repeat protein [Giardia muris]|uniref:WD40 repeat protein n=1 Tax=Giardia muris TaxID=5742 RepID=A0A4Z1T9J9_GIAMU|nr:WD40 repeat protein [Giardia muris]|eukprot:TNJ29827.1 WD40 repeat protein [Giardia muris]
MPVDPPSLIECFRGSSKPVRACAFEMESRQVVSAGDDRTVMVWSLTPPVRAFKFVGHGDVVSAAAYSPTEPLLATASHDKTVRLWTPNIHGSSIFRKVHTAKVRDVSFSVDGRSLVTCSDDKSVKVHDVQNLQFRLCLSGHTNWVRGARISPDGRLVASVSDDSTLRIWDLRTLSCIQSISADAGLSSNPHVVRWSPDGTSVATGGVKDIQLWDVRSTTLLQHYSCHSNQVTSLDFHPTGKYLVSAGVDGTARVLDLVQGRPLYTVRGHDGGINCVCFCPDGSVFATGGDDGRLMLFELAT